MNELDKELRTHAVEALETDAGCDPKRADALVQAVQGAASEEAIAIVAGHTHVFGSVVDRRVARLNRVIQALDASERMPTMYEVGVMFQITPAQGRNALRTYQARYAESHRKRLQSAVKAITPKSQSRNGIKVFVFSFDDPAVLEFAVERLRRRGLTRTVEIDQTNLDVVVERDEKDRFGKSADVAIKGE